MNKTEYKKYLNSKHWLDVRKRYKESKLNKGCCYCCKRKNNLNLHHKTYKRVGKENIDDLMFLCQECHTKEHKKLNDNKVNKKKKKKKSFKGQVECKNCKHFKFGYYCSINKNTPSYYYKKSNKISYVRRIMLY